MVKQLRQKHFQFSTTCRLVRAHLPVLLLLCSGCLGNPSEPVPATIAPEAVDPPASGMHAVRLASDFASAVESLDSPACVPLVSSSGYSVTRERDVFVSNQAVNITMTARLSGAWTGLRIGYRLDEGAITWSPSVKTGELIVTIPVRPGEEESDGFRWEFFVRTVNDVNQDCNSGSYSGSYTVDVVSWEKSPA